MPGPRLPVRKIRDVLKLSAAGMSKRQIAVSLGMSATAARDCILRARRAGLTWPLPEGLTDETEHLRVDVHGISHGGVGSTNRLAAGDAFLEKEPTATESCCTADTPGLSEEASGVAPGVGSAAARSVRRRAPR
jgi:hypothetical protein